MMRNCPVCESPNRETIGADYMKGWSMFRCMECEMIYLDKKDMTEAKLNDYYLHEYKTDDLPYSEERLNSLADYVVGLGLDVPIMDVGGTDGVLQGKLIERGFTKVHVCGPGDDFRIEHHKIFILSHTLEHIYNVRGMLERIKTRITMNGWVVVEVPIWSKYSHFDYDLHWQHINKFTPEHLEELFIRTGFMITESHSLPDYREYHCWRLAAKRV